ncbi:hypothetical protein WN944_007892 [Citrus x changshan-huyou]|uniref:Uncharacterized protein n=1 Tax=Citrus x changshan-huyou TaxID=2935761 RepID=A0AAP0MRL7_9ROSI
MTCCCTKTLQLFSWTLPSDKAAYFSWTLPSDKAAYFSLYQNARDSIAGINNEHGKTN